MIFAFRQALGRVGADQLGPIAGEQIGVGEEVGPDDLAAHGHHHADGMFVAQLREHLLARIHHGSGGLVHLLADGASPA